MVLRTADRYDLQMIIHLPGYGLPGMSQVGNLEGIYHFVLPMRNYTARKKSIGDSFNQVTSMVLNERNVSARKYTQIPMYSAEIELLESDVSVL